MMAAVREEEAVPSSVAGNDKITTSGEGGGGRDTRTKVSSFVCLFVCVCLCVCVDLSDCDVVFGITI